MKSLTSYIADAERKNGTYDTVLENATFGATNASNVAVCVGGLDGQTGSLGLGFDDNGDWGVYQSAKSKTIKKKPRSVVIKR